MNCVCVCVCETRLPPDPGCSVFHLQVQFQKIQQLRLSQSRASYYGGSLPNVNQIGKANTEFQVGLRGGPRPPDTLAPARPVPHGLGLDVVDWWFETSWLNVSLLPGATAL